MMAVRSDKQARAAVNNFETWYAHRLAQFGPYFYECTLDKSPLREARRRAPHSMLDFLIHVLQRMVHQFWGTATLDSYVMRCTKANGKCPPAIIALLFYLECPNLSPNIDVAIPDTRSNAFTTARLRVPQLRQHHQQLHQKRQQVQMQRS